jgi:CheY-like chemotaxis protein
MPHGGILKISAENFVIDKSYARTHIDAKVGQYVVVAVTDNGVGILPEHRDKIFEPFFTTKERGKGTGLGLSTSLAIAKGHHGFMNFYSEAGKGSSFKIYLPVAFGGTTEPETPKTEYVRGQGELILLVEDELAICEITGAILTSNGYRVLTAHDGAEAVALYTSNKYDIKVVLMDMAMPVMDGYMAIRALKKLDPKAKIIAVSGLMENGKLASVASYTSNFLAKPYSAERLLKTIEEVIKAK